jgi:hypothetical protein
VKDELRDAAVYTMVECGVIIGRWTLAFQLEKRLTITLPESSCHSFLIPWVLPKQYRLVFVIA